MEYSRLKDVDIKKYLNSSVNVKFLITNAEVKNGNKNSEMKYIAFRMRDNDKDIECKLFGANDTDIEKFVNGKIIGATIKVKSYAAGENGISCIVDGYVILDEAYSEYLMKEKGYETAQNRLESLISGIEDSKKREFVTEFLGENWKDFSTYPAANKMHHYGIHGLLVHSIEVAELSIAIANSFNEKLDKDILIAGSLLHDIGKIKEFKVSNGSTEYGVEASFLNHGLFGVEMISNFESRNEEKYKNLGTFILEIKHIMVSHHGRAEWGSPMRANTVEAKIIQSADDIDAFAYRYFDSIKNINSGEVVSVKDSEGYYGLYRR